MSNNLVVFAGAGASKAVSADLPTTVEFFERLPTEIKGQPIFDQIVSYLVGTLDGPEIDIEHVLWTLEEAKRDLSNFQSGRSAAGYLVRPSQTRVTVGHQYNLGHEDIIIASIKPKIDTLISDINRQVYDLYSYDPSPKELEKNWTSLLTKSWSRFGSVDIFTTNYDGVIEGALLALGLPPAEYESYLGLKGNRRKYLDLDEWAVGVPFGKGLLTKLHGSVDWKRHGKQIYISDASYGGNHEIHPIIYPGFKGHASGDFFDAFHSYLGERLGEANTVLFIGFAFRDEHINSILRERLRLDASIFVINPDQKVKLPAERLEPTYIREFFEEKSILKFTKALKL